MTEPRAADDFEAIQKRRKQLFPEKPVEDCGGSHGVDHPEINRIKPEYGSGNGGDLLKYARERFARFQATGLFR